LTTDGTTVFVANRFLGFSATKRPFIAPSVPGVTDVIPDTVVSCVPFPLVPTFIGLATAPEVCQGFSLFWDYLPQPVSNLQVLDLSDPRHPRHVAGLPLNSISSEIWDPNTWPNRVEMMNNRIAVHNFLGNVELLARTSTPQSLGVVGQVKRYGEFALRGPDGRQSTADDFDHEFVDATPFDDFAVTLVRGGVRVMSTDISSGENANQLAFWPMLGAFGGRVGSVVGFQWGGDDGIDTAADLAFVTTTDGILRIIDVTPPIDQHSPSVLGILPGTFGSMSFDACRGLAYLHGRNDKFHVIDFNDPRQPVELNTIGQLPLGLAALGPATGFNGNANENLSVFLTAGSDVAFIRVGTPGPVKFPSRGACRRRPAVSFINHQNLQIDPGTEALTVSNFVSHDGPGQTSDDLPTASTFTITSTDPDNFRLEVLDEAAARAGDGQVSASLQIGHASLPGPDCLFLGAQDITYALTKGAVHPLYRSKLIRLVTDDEEGGCLNLPSDDQAILVRLGDTITASYTSIRSGDTVTQKLNVGRPATEDYNGPNQRRHDIREVTIKVTVIDNRGGGLAALEAQTREAIQRDIAIASERLAQATIGVRELAIDFVPLPTLSGCNPLVERCDPLSDGFFGTPSPGSASRALNPDERSIVALKDSNPNSIDVFYVSDVQIPDGSIPGIAYPQATFPDVGAAQNFVVLAYPANANPGRGSDPYVMPHELLHILLNDFGHRTRTVPGTPPLRVCLEPESLFCAGGKRIGPFRSGGVLVEPSDTRTIRGNSESLPKSP
jgi:hypothetical protein